MIDKNSWKNIDWSHFDDTVVTKMDTNHNYLDIELSDDTRELNFYGKEICID